MIKILFLREAGSLYRVNCIENSLWTKGHSGPSQGPGEMGDILGQLAFIWDVEGGQNQAGSNPDFASSRSRFASEDCSFWMSS